MPQQVRTVNEVIVNAALLIGELGEGEVPNGFMLTAGLDIVNEILDKCASDSIYIPFLTTIASAFIVGQDTYSISDMQPADLTADRIVDLSFANYTVPASGVNPGPASSSFITNVAINSQLIMSSTSFATGTPVMVSVNNYVQSSPLQLNTVYYTIFVDSSHVLLATTLTNAQNGVFITLTSNGSGTGEQILTSQTISGAQPLPTSIVYPLRIINKATYWNVVRQSNLLARPGFILLNKQAQESFITVYPVPDQPYPFTIQVKAMINELVNQETLFELPPNYYGFLKYATARKFNQVYPSSTWTPLMEEEYKDYYEALKKSNETDLTIRPSAILTAPEPFYWPNILSY